MEHINIKITPELKALVTQAAKLDSRTLSMWVRVTLEREAKKDLKKAPQGAKGVCHEKLT